MRRMAPLSHGILWNYPCGMKAMFFKGAGIHQGPQSILRYQQHHLDQPVGWEINYEIYNPERLKDSNNRRGSSVQCTPVTSQDYARASMQLFILRDEAPRL